MFQGSVTPRGQPCDVIWTCQKISSANLTVSFEKKLLAMDFLQLILIIEFCIKPKYKK